MPSTRVLQNNTGGPRFPRLSPWCSSRCCSWATSTAPWPLSYAEPANSSPLAATSDRDVTAAAPAASASGPTRITGTLACRTTSSAMLPPRRCLMPLPLTRSHRDVVYAESRRGFVETQAIRRRFERQDNHVPKIGTNSNSVGLAAAEPGTRMAGSRRTTGHEMGSVASRTRHCRRRLRPVASCTASASFRHARSRRMKRSLH